MIPQVNQLVRIVLKNTTIIDGTVSSWGEEIIIDALDKKSVMIIPNPEDITLIKIYHAVQKPDVTETKQKFEKIAQQAPSELRDKSLVELKEVLNKEEKQAIAEKLKTHELGSFTPTEYTLPNFFKKKE